MLFIDHLYGTIDFRGTAYSDLIYEILGCPEIQRLRHMRLMNFDVPYIQDLASTKRFPHSIGTCYLAVQILEKSPLSLSERKMIVAAALIHDVGILPFGHLLESIIKAKKPNFSHERIVYSILTGTYHPTNIYHQILGSETLRLPKILKKHKISPGNLYNIICPEKGQKSAISADIDLDNIDNIHRMAALLGDDNAKSNLMHLIDCVSITKDYRLSFSQSSKEYVEYWLNMRQCIYTMIIGHPENIPYNAFLSKLLKTAVDNGIVDSNEWYITDALFENRLLENRITHDLAAWLYTKPRFELVDYVWLISNHKPNLDLKEIEAMILEENLHLPLSNKSTFYWFWSENKLISREISISINEKANQRLGIDSHSILISLVSKSDYRTSAIKVSESGKNIWRRELISFVSNKFKDWKFSTKFPEDYSDSFFNSKIVYEQLRIFE